MNRILKLQSSGKDVAQLQQALNKAGNYGLIADGYFGFRTQAAVIDFQNKNGLYPDGIAGQQTFAKLKLLKKDAPPKLCVIHVSATPERTSGWSAQRVVDYHTKTLGWDRPGYSRIIEFDGKVVETWKVDLTDGLQPFEITHGTRGYNPISVHICLIGGMDSQNKNPKDTRTPEQKASLEKVMREILEICPDIQFCGHNQLNNKNCPCFSVPKYCRELGIPEKNILTADPFGYIKYYETGRWF